MSSYNTHYRNITSNFPQNELIDNRDIPDIWLWQDRIAKMISGRFLLSGFGSGSGRHVEPHLILHVQSDILLTYRT